MPPRKPPAQDHARFRAWLIEKVKRSRWVTRQGDSVEVVARRIGVQPDVLVQAQAELSEERRRGGKRPVLIGTGRILPGRRKQIDLDLPKVVNDDWLAYCHARDMSGSVVLRSIIHTLLSGPENPTWTGRTWWYRGKTHRLSNYAEVAARGWWPYNAKTDVSPGAGRALMLRAQRLGCTYTGLVRGAIIDLLEGRTKRLIVVAGAAAMWEDESRYWTGNEAP
jgi:hypothetical protein